MPATRDGGDPVRSAAFLFPPETTFRFYALLAALFGGLSFVWAWLYLTLPSTRTTMASEVSVCIRAAVQGMDAYGAEEQKKRLDAAQRCLSDFNVAEGFFVAGCLAATALAVLLLHLLRPFYVIARQRLRPLEAVADPDALPPFRAALDRLVAEAGLARAPIVLVRDRARTDAFTFGHWFRRYLCLDSGLVVEFFTNRPAFEAKIRHELAHFRNRDISKADVTTISWWLFVLTVPLAFLYSFYNLQGSPSTRPDTAALAWRFAVIVGAVYLARNAVFRAREFDADLRAHGWDGPGGGLIAALRSRPEPAPRWRLPGLLRLHPSAGERVAALQQPGSLVQPATLMLPAVIGLAFGVGEPPGKFILTFFTQKWGSPVLGSTITACLFLLPLAGWAGVAIWRDAWGPRRRGLPDLFAAALGLSAALGIIGGFRLSFMAFVGVRESIHPVLPVLILTLFFLWVRAGAYWWLSSPAGRRLAVPACWVGLGSGTFILVALWTKATALYQVHGVFTGAGANGFDIIRLFITYLVASPSTTLFFLLLFLFLAAPRWMGLAPEERRRVLRRRGRQVLAGAALFTVLILAERLAVRRMVAPEVRETDQFRLWFFFAMVLTGAALQAGLAFWMALRRPVASIGETCFCTLCAGLLMAVAMLALNLAFGGGLDFSFARNTLCQFANTGAMAALPMAALGAGLRFMVSGFRPLSVAAVPA